MSFCRAREAGEILEAVEVSAILKAEETIKILAMWEPGDIWWQGRRVKFGHGGDG